MHILISDDHAVLRDGLRPFVSQIADDITIYEAEDFASTHKMLSGQAIDLVILDLRMPGMNGMEGATRLKREFSDIPIVIISGWMTYEDALNALNLKFHGYLPKSMSGTAMIHALRLILCGVPYFPPEIFSQASSEPHLAQAPTSVSEDVSKRNMRTNTSSLEVLTRREKEILTHLVEGASNRKIADSLGLTEITIKSHLRNVFRKIGANNRTQAVTFALNAGIKGVSDHSA